MLSSVQSRDLRRLCSISVFFGPNPWQKFLLSLLSKTQIRLCSHPHTLHLLNRALKVLGLRAKELNRTERRPTLWGGVEEMLLCSSLVLHLLEEFVGGILVAVLLHLGQVTLLWCHSCIHLWTRGGGVTNTRTMFDLWAQTGEPFTSITPWWIEVYCFFLSITKVMTMTVAMTTPPTISPIMAPLLDPASLAKNTWH